MNQHKIGEPELNEDEQTFDGDIRRFPKSDTEQPKRSPIRRKNKMRQEERVKSKAKRNSKKEQHRIKYEWQEY